MPATVANSKWTDALSIAEIPATSQIDLGDYRYVILKR